MKQTAVEWLENQIKKSWHYFRLMEDINSRSTIAQPNIFEQAKAMEKEQIIKALKDSWNLSKHSNFDNPHAEQYYNETYESNT